MTHRDASKDYTRGFVALCRDRHGWLTIVFPALNADQRRALGQCVCQVAQLLSLCRLIRSEVQGDWLFDVAKVSIKLFKDVRI